MVWTDNWTPSGTVSVVSSTKYAGNGCLNLEGSGSKITSKAAHKYYHIVMYARQGGSSGNVLEIGASNDSWFTHSSMIHLTDAWKKVEAWFWYDTVTDTCYGRTEWDGQSFEGDLAQLSGPATALALKIQSATSGDIYIDNLTIEYNDG